MNNFKVRCVHTKYANFTKGKIYVVINGRLQNEDGDFFDFESFDDANSIQFELVEESEPVESVVTEDEHGTLHIQFEEKENIPKLKSEPNYKELYEKAMDELQAMEEKNIPRDNFAKIGEIIYQSAHVFLSGFLADAHDDTKDLFDKVSKNLDICEVEVEEFINDFVNFRTKSIVNPMQKLSEERNLEIEKLAEVNGNLVRSNMNKDSEIKQLKKCLKKQYKFIDKLLPKRIEV